MHIISHLPAPAALYDPLHGNAQRAARAAQRIGAQEPVNAYGNNRVRRDPLRSETVEPVDHRDARPQVPARHDGENVAFSGHRAASLFFVQRFAQEEAADGQPGFAHERAVSNYPSLDFDGDILLPGEAVPVGWTDQPRLDLVV